MISERLNYLSRAECPVCGDDRETIFKRDPLTNDLVCRAHFPRHTLVETVKPADVWESWSIDLEVDRMFEEQL